MVNLNSLGINSGTVIAIVALSEIIKNLDKKKKFKRFYVLLPFAFSIIFAIITNSTITISNIIYTALMLFGASSFSYSVIKKSLGNPGTWGLTGFNSSQNKNKK